MKYKESKISAHHNYLVNNMLSPGFVVGDPKSDDGFFFLADLVLPGESTPRISSRIVDQNGQLLLELDWNRMRKNPGKFTHQPIPGGFQIINTPENPILSVTTQAFTNGYLTCIKATLYDERGVVRIVPLGGSIEVKGKAELALENPF
jgi:hypothetical protein